jgi:hypothetical protein
MKDQTRAAFEETLAEIRARATAQATAQGIQRAEREQFEREFRRLRDRVIVPALNEIQLMLEPQGWICQIQVPDNDRGLRVVFLLFKGNMSAVGGYGRPFLSFEANMPNIVIQVLTTRKQISPEPSATISDVTEDFVQNIAPKFFKLLAA